MVIAEERLNRTEERARTMSQAKREDLVHQWDRELARRKAEEVGSKMTVSENDRYR